MQITIFTLFPHWFDGPLGDSVLGRAREARLLDLRLVNFREFAEDKHQSVDDAPYGGGGGMVLRADVLARAMDATIGAPGTPGRPRVHLMSPRGRTFDQDMAGELARQEGFALLCGHYEAIDERLIETRVDEEISLGDFVLTGGEIAAMAVVDAVMRLREGVLGNEASAVHESFMSGLLEGPHYTRPELFEGRAVPDVLRSGDHGAIARWRKEQALALTQARRPELLAQQLFHPDVVRKIARRRRPFVVYRMTQGAVERLFECSAVKGFPEEILLRSKGAERGLDPATRLLEIKEGRSESLAEDQRRVEEDVMRGAEDTKGVACRFLKNLVAEIDSGRER